MQELEFGHEAGEFAGSEEELPSRVLVALKVGFGGDDHTKHTVRGQPVDHDGEQVALEIVGHRHGVEGTAWQRIEFEVGLDGGDHELIGAASLTGLRQPDVAYIDDGDGEAELGEVPRIIGSAASDIEQGSRFRQPGADEFDQR